MNMPTNLLLTLIFYCRENGQHSTDVICVSYMYSIDVTFNNSEKVLFRPLLLHK